jgi:hypothetical protein
MGILDKIKEIEDEVNRTQKNKATEGHLGLLKARLAKLRTQLMEGESKSSGGGDGFDVPKTGDARVALIGFPSVGKSTLLSALTNTSSEAASYEFTTLTCIPGNMDVNGTRIQLLDLPGIIEGAAHGRGRGREVIAVTRSCDLVMIVLDAGREHCNQHREILERELETVGIRLNKSPPDIAYRRKREGGIKFNSTVPLTKLGEDPEDTVRRILHENKIHHCELLMRGDYDVDEVIDVVMGNRTYLRCMYVFNKIDTISVEDLDTIASRTMDHWDPANNSTTPLFNNAFISVHEEIGLNELKFQMWDIMNLTRIYTKRRGQPPDLDDPFILSHARGGITVQSAVEHISRELLPIFKYALVWGRSVKQMPQRVGLSHHLRDEDVIQIFTQTTKQQRESKGYHQRVQQHWDKTKKRRKGKK